MNRPGGLNTWHIPYIGSFGIAATDFYRGYPNPVTGEIGLFRRTESDAERDISLMMENPGRAVKLMAIPVGFALLIAQINSFVDAAWCATLGSNALAVIGLSSALYLILVGIGTGIGVGGSTAVARRIGLGDHGGANSRASHAIALILAISLILTPVLLILRRPLLTLMGAGVLLDDASDYVIPMFLGSSMIMLSGVIAGLLRAENAVKRSVAILVMGSVLNLILDPVFIFYFDLGVTGSPVATVTATTIANSVGVYWYLRRKMYVRPSLRKFRFRKDLLNDILYVGTPQTTELVFINAVNLLLNWFVISSAGPEGLAIYTMPFIFINMATIPATAVATALIPICSVAFARRDYDRAWQVYHDIVRITLIFVILLGIAVFIGAEYLVTAFTYSPDSAGLRPEMAMALRIYCLCLPFWGMIPLGSAMLQSLRKAQKSTLSAVIRNLMLIGFYAFASTISLEAILWSFALVEVIGGTMMYLWGTWAFKSEKSRYLIPENSVSGSS
jgi:putative MATE family efflux protein